MSVAANGRNFRIDLSYDGTDFFGWQIQPNVRTVQGELVRALTRVFDEPVQVIGAGRTDTGVHATRQVASVSTDRVIPAAGLARALNALLPADVHVARVIDVPTDFHARFSAIRRTYRYRIVTRPGPFRRRYAWVLPEAPDPASLNAAMAPWLGLHSFHAFTQGEGALGNTRCRIDRALWREQEGRLILVLTADRFLYRMVRLLVAVLVDAHRRGCLEPGIMARLVTEDATRPPVAPAPACGLFLAGVDYAETTGLE
ncbi:MAG: tRNA pseudouridine(38-40) synthase TruA [Candidatus Eisenbacteria bacterium]|nr:tRNA pseudouridine(38-40) synthase TruA [Candidatus Eisenbacteria bacterium]